MKFIKIKNTFSQKLNNLLYESREGVYTSIKIITSVGAAAALGLLIYIFGFEPGTKYLIEIFRGFDIIFGIFVLSYLVRLIYAFKRIQFIRDNKFEGILVIIILLNSISNYVYDNLILENIFKNLGISSYAKFYQIFTSLYMFVIIGHELIKVSSLITRVKIKPATTFILSFLILISVGTGLLMLPATTVQRGSMPLLEAIFTSVSACCVTGLIVVDTAAYFILQRACCNFNTYTAWGLGYYLICHFFCYVITA